MDFTGLYNAIMQLIFIITGLVSIKSLTEMITQLVGQGDALKDGADTMKEVKSMAGKAAGAGLHGAGLAVAGVKAAAGVARKAAGSSYGQRVKEAAGDWVDRRLDNRDDWIENGTHKYRHADWYARQVRKHRERVSTDNVYVDTLKLANRNALTSQEYAHQADTMRKQGDFTGAAVAEANSKLYAGYYKDAMKSVLDMQKDGFNGEKISKRGRVRGGAYDLAFTGQYLARGGKQVSKNAGFEDGIGVGAMIKGDKSKDTVINQFLHGNYARDSEGNIMRDKEGKALREDNNFATTINNANKFVFNITGAKGDVKDFLNNADVLESIEDGNSALARQMQRLVAQTGAKSDKKGAQITAKGQAEANAKAMSAQTQALNNTMAAIAKQLEDIKNNMGGGGSP